MPQIDFYIIKEFNALNFACRLCDTAYQRGHGLWVIVESSDAAKQLDELLWTFNDIGFIPHCIYQTQAINLPPIILATPDQTPIQTQIVLNLSTTLPDFIFNFNRIMEIVPEDPEYKKTAREHFRAYRDRGWEITTHDLKK